MYPEKGQVKMYIEIESRNNMKKLVFDETSLAVGADRVYPYDEINAMEITKAPLFATYGILTIRLTNGRDVPVPFPRSYAEKIRRAIHEVERIREKGADTPDRAAGTDPYEEAKKLKELLDLGIVSEEEYEHKRKELLGL